ncbi:Hypothetical protein R9X50_00600300 [Acrodontium crateriforme]|uniref:Probable acetate kinase n=1 Tax=Acrodontium crateriforme TaxID=150365 RepID=A0AAQ3MAC7_9PEZI|nr:Hypothetical protein R9X50_00600300 [Acrodontium crateriforme]
MTMSQIILAVNAGSSSVKVSVFATSEQDQPKQLAVIQIAGLTAPPAKLTYNRGDEQIKNREVPDVKSAQDAYEHILQHLTSDSGLPELSHADDITFACHRVVHGGDYDKPARIDKETYHRLEELSDLAPLHNGGALAIVEAVHSKCPNAINVAFFDSAFHASIPTATRTYAIDPTIAERNKLRKYGFHGLSYAFIARAVAESINIPLDSANLIALHLGSGASACCIRGGKSLDTSMGLTPLAGLPGATRSGDVDPSLIFHLTSDAGKLSPSSTKELHITTAEEVLNKQCGWKAMTGTTDFGDISKRAEEGDEKCQLAIDVLVDRIVGYVAGYYVKLQGEVDGLVFAGGIGEKGAGLRKAVVNRLSCLGFEIDEAANGKPGDDTVVEIGAKGAKHRVLVCQTDEQAEMARQCALQAEELKNEKSA